jgi:Fe-S-cluster containining protein
MSEHGFQMISADAHFHYDCNGCGDCCRNIKNAVMVEGLDLYNLARFLGLEMSEVIAEYTDTTFLAWGFPVFMLKTKPHQDTCVFLKSSRCSVHDAKPRTCRLYPLGIGPDDDRPGEWLNFIVSKKQHHFTETNRRVGDWVESNLTPEDMEFIISDYTHTGELAKLMGRIDKRREDEIIKLILYFKYMAYDMTEPFMPQYSRNMEHLKAKFERLGGR